jgi:CubicO group peptidase (beta-lactamase class C family)
MRTGVPPIEASIGPPTAAWGVSFSHRKSADKLVDVVTLASGLAVEASPQDVGFDPERLNRLDRYLDAYVESGQQKGSLIAISRGGKLAHVSMRGHRDAAAGLPVEADTIWRMYSMTKPITSVAAMMLYEEGKLSLFDPVAKFIPAFEHVRVYRNGSAAAMVSAPAANPMLVWHLLTHTSGLTYDFFFTHPVDEMYRKAGFGVGAADATLAEACDRWAAIPLLFEPGTAWNYSVSTDVLGRVVEVASGQTLEEFFSQRILEPLGMRDTGFFVPEADDPRLARLYAPDPRTGAAEAATNMDRPRTERPRMLSGGAGLRGTAVDYLRFCEMLLRRGELDDVRLLAPHTVDLMSTNHLPGGALMTPPFGRALMGISNEGRGFGLGFSILLDPAAAKSISSRGEYSWGGAAGTAFWVDPTEELTVVFCTQVLFARDELSYHLRQMVYQALVD